MVKFEHLPNEILILCFEYLNALEIFYGFKQLNYRLTNLISSIPLHINFENVNQIMLENFRRQLLLNTKLINQIYSIKLLNKRDYLRYSQLFFYSSLNDLSNLRQLKSIEPFTFDTNHRSLFINLKYQYSSINSSNKFLLNMNKMFAIINLTIIQCNFSDFYDIFKYFPSLKYLHVNRILSYEFDEFCQENQILAINLSQLTIDELNDEHLSTLENLFKQTLNLKSLKLCSTNCEDMINAHQWEQLIKMYLSKLKIFQFKFECTFSNMLLKQCQEFERNIFFQEEHHWFTEYTQTNQSILIFTIPYPSNTFQLTPNHAKHYTTDMFIQVTNLFLDSTISIQNCQCYFPNVTSLTITSHRNNQLAILQDITSLKNLINLSSLETLNIHPTITIQNPTTLLDLVKETPKLSTMSLSLQHLRFCYADRKLCKIFSKTIQNFQQSDDIPLSNCSEFCAIFSNIKHLKCQIANEKDLEYLIKSLPNISTMNLLYRCKNNFEMKHYEFTKILRRLNVFFQLNDDLNSNFQLENQTDFFHHNIYIFIYRGNSN